jgi:hypothetical protein
LPCLLHLLPDIQESFHLTLAPPSNPRENTNEQNLPKYSLDLQPDFQPKRNYEMVIKCRKLKNKL